MIITFLLESEESLDLGRTKDHAVQYLQLPGEEPKARGAKRFAHYDTGNILAGKIP